MFADDVRPLVALDWSFSGIHVTFDGREVTRLSGVEELLEQLQDEPHRIVAESTFESWDLARRHALVARVRDEGHELYVYRPIHTARSCIAAKGDGMSVAPALIPAMSRKRGSGGGQGSRGRVRQPAARALEGSA